MTVQKSISRPGRVSEASHSVWKHDGDFKHSSYRGTWSKIMDGEVFFRLFGQSGLQVWFTGFKDALRIEQGRRGIVVASKVKGKNIYNILFLGFYFLSWSWSKEETAADQIYCSVILPENHVSCPIIDPNKVVLTRFNNSGVTSLCTKLQHKFGSFLNQYFFWLFTVMSSFYYRTVRNERRSQRVIVFLLFHWNILLVEDIWGSYITEKSQVSSLPRYSFKPRL